MGCWDMLPNELLNAILNNETLEDCPEKLQHWSTVNRQWFYIYQKKKYKHLVMNKVDSRSIIFNNILYSSFQPGLVVNTLKINELDRDEEMNRSISPLKVMLLKCPNIKEFYLGSKDDYFWVKLLHLLDENHVWKNLRHLEPPVNASIYYKYYRCALHFKNTLETLSLRSDMMYVVDAMLETFKSLKCLMIDKSIYDDIQKCNFIFKALPTITSLCINFSDFIAIYPKTKRESNANLFKRIQELKLIGFTPFHYEEFMRLKTEFRTIEKLTILPAPGFIEKIHWPLTDNIDSMIAFKSFIRYIYHIPSVELMFKIENPGWVLQEFFEYYDSVPGQDRIDLSFKVVFFENKRAPNNRIHIKTNKNEVDIKVMLKKMLGNDTHNLWGQSSQKVDNMTLKMKHQLSDIEIPLNTILSNYKNLHHLTIYRGSLMTSISAPVLNQSVKHLVFHETLCHHDYLLSMSNAFPYLKSIHFDDCYFPYNSPKPHLDAVNMLGTTVDTFEYSYNHTKHCPIYTLISVCSVDDHFQKYFLDVEASESMIEIPQDMFLSMVEHPGTTEDPFGHRETEVFYIKIKSAKRFVFNKKNYPKSKYAFVCNVGPLKTLTIDK